MDSSMSNTIFFVPKQLPPRIVLKSIDIFAPQIDLNYVAEGYTLRTPNTFWVQEYVSNHAPNRTHFRKRQTIKLFSHITGTYYIQLDGTTTNYELIYVIPSTLTNLPSMTLIVGSGQTPYQKTIRKNEMIWVANQIIANAVTVTH